MCRIEFQTETKIAMGQFSYRGLQALCPGIQEWWSLWVSGDQGSIEVIIANDILL